MDTTQPNGPPVSSQTGEEPLADVLPPGTLVGAYRLGRPLGQGGMATVYQAEHTGLNKPVALKLLHPELRRNPQTVARFRREGRAAARLRHPHIIDVTDFGDHEGLPFLVMELLSGESLKARLARGPLPVAEAVDLLLPVCSALCAAHAEGIVHRDLKPDNLFLAITPDGTLCPKVLDFGISKFAGDAALTRTRDFFGTPLYMPPEQFGGARAADARSDQFSLAAVLYECLTGRTPFVGESLQQLMFQAIAGQIPAPRALRPELPEDLDATLRRALSRDPAERFPRIEDLAAALLPHASPAVRARFTPAFAGSAQTLQPQSRPWQIGRHPLLLSGTAALALLLLVSAGAWLLRAGHQDPRAEKEAAKPAPAPAAPAPAPTAPAAIASPEASHPGTSGAGVAPAHREAAKVSKGKRPRASRSRGDAPALDRGTNGISILDPSRPPRPR